MNNTIKQENVELNKQLGMYADLCIWDNLTPDEFEETYNEYALDDDPEVNPASECDPDAWDIPVHTNPADNLDLFVNEFLKFQLEQINNNLPCFLNPILFRESGSDVWYFTSEI